MSARGGRPRTGSLIWRKTGWSARYWVLQDGEWMRTCVSLGTDNKAVARRKLAKLVELSAAEAMTADQVIEAARQPETMGDVVKRLVADQGEQGLKTWQERLSRLRRLALPHIERLEPGQVRSHHIKSILEEAGRTYSKQTVTHLRNDLSAVFGDLWSDELISENPVARAKLPKKLKVDHRPRVQLTDPEFAKFMACPDVPEVLQLKALSSRSFGGQRTSDLHAWDWSHFNLDTWETAKVYRPKTDGEIGEVMETELVELVFPEPLRTMLHAYWTTRGKPTVGPVFPRLRGAQAGERQGKRSHARELRRYLWLAGVHRPLPGFNDAVAQLKALDEALAGARAENAKGRVRELQRQRLKALLTAQALDAIQANCQRTRCADFHSFRRSFNSALAAAGLNVQQAMALAGHKNPATHMRYVDLQQHAPLVMPAKAVPVLPRLLPKLGDSVGPSNHNPAVLLGDPSENRTRVTGVRGRPTPHHGSSFRTLTTQSPSVDDARTGQTTPLCQNSVPKLGACSRPADAALAAYLSALAVGLANQLVGVG